MSEQPSAAGTPGPDEESTAGATSEEFGNLSVEDDSEGTTDPAELTGTESPSED